MTWAGGHGGALYDPCDSTFSLPPEKHTGMRSSESGISIGISGDDSISIGISWDLFTNIDTLLVADYLPHPHMGHAPS